MRRSQFKKHLDHLNEEELRAELMLLFQKVKEVKAYYSMELGSEEERLKLYKKAKVDIASKYATKSFRKPRRPRIQKINRILADMKKQTIFQHELADLYLFDIETAISFARRYNFYSKVLSNHIVQVFHKACRIIRDQAVQSQFQERCDHIMDSLLYFPTLHMELYFEYRKTF